MKRLTLIVVTCLLSLYFWRVLSKNSFQRALGSASRFPMQLKDQDEIRFVSRVASWFCRKVLRESPCLISSFVVFAIGPACCKIKLGIEKSRGEPFSAHAWVEMPDGVNISTDQFFKGPPIFVVERC